MGLDTSYDCWHGAYSAFHRWRTKIAEVAGYGDINAREGFGGGTPWPSVEDDVLVVLLDHSDCEGDIPAEYCAGIANRLESLLPALEISGDGGGHIGAFAEKTQTFINGLRAAAAASDSVEFR